MKYLVIVFLMVLPLIGCGTLENENKQPGEEKTMKSALVVNGSFEVNSQEWSMRLQNKSGESSLIEFTSAQEIEVIIKKAEETVYRYSDEKMFSQALKSLTLEKEETRKWSESLSQKLESGSYTITYEVLANKINGSLPTTAITDSETFTIP
ncbi:hypothetical protein D7Z54_22060 [Salibacterium salarium]|uniref:Intracellular proteinase inhibitor BsuPI domain-containing protein n=1 Tax=Salibacterium salarium TaxID=284579 RepID=A0A428MYM8_9BACI|nr:BsuPI-related putative proteinase inhibitor [Salibacterium salarium]RSL31196.1 hypothetical protein D7Z54_22060 [Salibacterium salarium]